MKCYWTYEGDDKFWIPGCMASAVRPEDDGKCWCRIHENERRKKLKQEAKENDPEYKARQENKMLWKENAILHRIIERLTKRKLH